MQDNVLDDIGILEGTDKSSTRWDYLRHYQEVFRDWRDDEFNLIEIGVAGGNSILTWRKFFARANIVGIDISESARRCRRDGIEIEIGSQADESFLNAVSDKYPPSIVIDDGSHQADHIMVSFRAIFPRLAPGGWYVIEDLNITGSQDKVPVTPHLFFSRAAHALLNRKSDDQSAIAEHIDRIDCAPGIVFVRKKDPRARHARLMRDVELVERTRNANNYHWLATRMAEDYGDLPQAETLARRAAELHPGAAVYHLGLSRILQQRCNTEGSVEAARNAVAAEPANFESHFQLAAALLDLGDLRQASEAFDKSIDAAPKYLRIHVTNRWDKIRGKAI